MNYLQYGIIIGFLVFSAWDWRRISRQHKSHQKLYRKAEEQRRALCLDEFNRVLNERRSEALGKLQAGELG